MKPIRISSTWIAVIVWAMRLAVGALFVFSGFSKAVDPWGFMYKIGEYLAVWNIDWVPREAVFMMTALLAMVEFTGGVMLALGCLKRASVWILLAMMAFLLPLTAYVAIANPVDDCGCFGDALILSNWATFYKNVALTAGLLALLKYNFKVDGLILPLFQWIAIAACMIYCVVLSINGYMIQPMMDFRSYPVGASLAEDDEDFSDMLFVYEKDGEERAFTATELPDSTWTFVRRDSQQRGKENNFAFFDDDVDMTQAVMYSEGPFVILAVSNPARHSRARASMANRLNDYVEQHDGAMIGLLPLSGDALDSWKAEAHPNFEVFTADATLIKELARGDAAIVYLKNGIIQWKRNMYALPGDFPDYSDPEALDKVYVIDSGDALLNMSVVLAAILIFLSIIGLSRHATLRHRKRKCALVKSNFIS